MIVFVCVRDGDTIDSDVTLTDQGVEKIIGHGREVCKVHILSRSPDQFSPEVDFDIYIYVRIVIGRYKKIPDHFDPRGRWVYTRSLSTRAQTSE